MAYYIFKKNFSLKADDVISEHIKRYDNEIKRLREYRPTTSNPAFYRKLLNEANMCLLDTLHQKERLLGFHSKSFSLKIYNTINVNSNKIKKDSFDLSKLTLNEKIEFVNLINKATKTEDEMDPNVKIEITKNKKEEETIDIEHIEVKKEEVQEKTNIELIEVEEPEERIYNDEKMDAQITISEKLKQALLKKAEIEFSRLKDQQLPSEKEIPKTKNKKR